MSKSLPTEIINHEIFPKLPVKSLLRFKCLSKSFNALISSPEFVQLHVRESRSMDANRFLILSSKDGRNLYSIDVDSPDSVITTIPLPRSLDEQRPWEVSIVGSFDGLICVVLKQSLRNYAWFKHVLINPSTRVFQDIIPSMQVMQLPKVSLYWDNQSSFGFGFDDLNGDFKLVRIITGLLYDDDVSYRQVIVFNLNRNTWKLVEFDGDIKDSFLERQKPPNGVLIKTHLLHWIFREFSGSNHYRIACFDIRSEKWARDVPLTMDLFEHDRFPLESLGVINGCLCLSTYSATTSSRVLWMLKDYEEANESWVKLFDINQFLSYRFLQLAQPFFCLSRGSKNEVLVPKWKREGIYWYDIGPITYGTIRDVKIIPAYVGGCLFTESLIQISGGSHIHGESG